MNLQDKVVFITGASSGIGKALAINFAKRKAKLILSARREAELQEVKAACLKHTNHCEIILLDVSDAASINDKAKQALNMFGHINILINNAGISQRSLVVDTPIEIDRKVMEINYFGTVAITKALLPNFKKNNGGHIVVISSITGLFGFHLRSAYAASKHALHGFFESLQVENSIPGLYTTLVCPGRIQTPISLSAITATGEPHGKMDEAQLNGIPVDVCAERIITAMLKKKKLIYIVQNEWLLIYIKRFCEPLFHFIVKKIKPV